MATLKTAEDLRTRLAELAVDLPFDETLLTGTEAPLARPYDWQGGRIGNRFCILPMEGWDGTEDGRPTELTQRRWRNFGLSGGKLIWGGEAVAVRPDGRANPNQLMIDDKTVGDIADLRQVLVDAHKRQFGDTSDLLVGLQLTHSGRFARPNSTQRFEPRVAYRHPHLDGRVGISDDGPVLSDDDIAWLVDDFIRAARLAQKAGFAFVDVKHCHGYFGHELLSAFDRPGRYGGSLENRTRFLCDITTGIRAEAPRLEIGIRVSVFDTMPFQQGADGVGVPAIEETAARGQQTEDRSGVENRISNSQYRYAFGGDGTGLGIDLQEPAAFLELLLNLDIELVCSTAGSPYYNPHIQRPAAFPPSDGYLPPEDPLVGVARQIEATARLRTWLAKEPSEKSTRERRLALVGSGYSYLQEWLPHVGQRVVREGMADFIGLGAHGVGLSGVCSGCVGRPAAGPQALVPYLQRLHHGAVQWHGVGLLSARSVLPGSAREAAAGADQEQPDFGAAP